MIKDKYEQWKNSILNKSLEKHKQRKESFSTSSGIKLDEIYLPHEIDYMDKLGFPGKFPFTRGVQPTMYRGRLWTMRQYAGFSNAEESNKRFRYLLEQGQTGLSVAFDLPTQIGYDPDDPISSGEVGKVGVSVSSLDDMEVLFDNIPLDKVSTSMTINAPAAIILAMYIAVAKKQGIEIKKLRGTVQNDILKEYIARGTYIFPPKPSLRLITDVIEYCSEELPHWNTISISGYHIREAGSTAVQEIAFTLANAISYVEQALNIGLDIDDFAKQLSFFFNSHNDFLEEIAKFRAARRTWANIMKFRFNAKNERSMMLRFHTQTAGSSLTAQQPENNIIRVTMQALSAVLGGTQSLHTNSMDEAYCLPTEQSVQLALRTQQIIAHESNITSTIDPLAGSFLVEYLTDEIEKGVVDYLEKIDKMGGVILAIENGFIQNEIHLSAYDMQKKIEDNENILVGVNKYVIENESNIDKSPLINTFKNEEKQKRSLMMLRDKRNDNKVSELLTLLESNARRTENLMPLFIQCVENSVTLGEICSVLRGVWGEYHSVI